MLREAHRVQSHHAQREDLSVSLSSSSVSDRTGRPVGDRAGRPAEQSSQEAQIRTLLYKQKEQILAECQAEINRHEFKPLTTEEVYENWVKLLNLNKKNFTALELKKFNDEINSFFQDSCCSKIWNYVKRTRKVSMNGRVKEVSEFHLRHYCKKKISRGSGHYFGTFWPNTRIAK